MLRSGLAQPTFLLSCLLLAVHTAFAGEVAAVSGDVQAILDRNCVKCHGPLEQNAELRLDSVAGIGKGSTDGPIVVVGKPESSKLIQVLAPDADPHMPPKKQLGEGDISVLREWIAKAATKPGAESRQVARELPPEPTAAIDHFL